METFSFCATIDEQTTMKTMVPHPRSSEYKVRSITNSQEERRLKLLEEQRRNRAESFNRGRDLIEDIVLGDAPGASHDDMEWNDIKKKRFPRHYRGRLMLSEWLVDVPTDLADKWFLVPCPEGKRTLVVATRSKTQAYSKSGYLMDTFPSVLPGGHVPNVSPCNSLTLLDCIWSKSTNQFYVLDVLAWNNQPLLECETEFRFYWLKSKLSEMPELSETSPENRYAFSRLPFYDCQPATLEAVMTDHPAFPGGVPKLDGVLLYHSAVHYTPGLTPLVGWLKPFMLTEVLGVQVAEPYLLGRPQDYDCLLKFIKQEAEKRPWRRRRWKRKPQVEAMESETVEDEEEEHRTEMELESDPLN